MMTSRTTQRAGFSLIEVLVATAVLCVLVVLLNQVIGSAMDVVGQGRRVFEIHSKARAALDLLGRDLNQGLYRDDVKSFQDGNGNTVLAFFTRRGSTIGAGENPASYRQLSFVAYEARDEESAGFSLWRGTVNVQWDGAGTYPVVSSLNAPMPFAENAAVEGYAKAIDATDAFQPILKGVVRLELRFLGTDGRYYENYNANGVISKAAVVTMLVIDDRAESILRENPTLLTSFRQSFLGGGFLQAPDVSSETLGSLWDETMNQSTIWEGMPQRFRKGVAAVERIIPLR